MIQLDFTPRPVRKPDKSPLDYYEWKYGPRTKDRPDYWEADLSRDFEGLGIPGKFTVRKYPSRYFFAYSKYSTIRTNPDDWHWTANVFDSFVLKETIVFARVPHDEAEASWEELLFSWYELFDLVWRKKKNENKSTIAKSVDLFRRWLSS